MKNILAQDNDIDKPKIRSPSVESNISINTLSTAHVDSEIKNDLEKDNLSHEVVHHVEANKLKKNVTANGSENSLDDHTYYVKEIDADTKNYTESEKNQECSDHTYCVGESATSTNNTDYEISNTTQADHTYCINDSNMHLAYDKNQDNDKHNLDHSDTEEPEDIAKVDHTLMEDRTCSAEKFNVSDTESLDYQTIIVDSQDCELYQTLVPDDGNTDSEHVSLHNVQTDGTCNMENSDWISSSPVCLSPNSILNPNPQGVTYIKSLNIESNTNCSPWKQTVTSPPCTTYHDITCAADSNTEKKLPKSIKNMSQSGFLKSESSILESPVISEQSNLCSEFILNVDSYVMDDSVDEWDKTVIIDDTKDKLTKSELTSTNKFSASNDLSGDICLETDSEISKGNSLKKNTVHSELNKSPELIEQNSLYSTYVLSTDSFLGNRPTEECNKSADIETTTIQNVSSDIDLTLTNIVCSTTHQPSTMSPDSENMTNNSLNIVHGTPSGTKGFQHLNNSSDTESPVLNEKSALLSEFVLNVDSYIVNDLTTELDKSTTPVMSQSEDIDSTLTNSVIYSPTHDQPNDRLLETDFEIIKDISLETMQQDSDFKTTSPPKSRNAESETPDIVGVQDLTLSTKCSEQLDKSINTEAVDKTTVKCSPMTLSVCDAAVQNIPDTHSAMNSPFIMYDTKNTSINTDVPDTDDASVGTETPATIFVNIIRDQPAVSDKSINTDKTMVSNVWTGTENVPSVSIGINAGVDTVEVGVEARPELETVYTEMTDLPMTTVGTSMTPVKLVNKFGKR